MGHARSGKPWLALLSAAAIVAALITAGPLVPLVEVAEAQEESAVTLPAMRVPSSDPASDYVNDRIEMVTAQAEAKEAEAAAAPPADASTEPAADSTGEAAATETSGETPPAETKKGGKGKGAGEEPPADTPAAEGDAAPAEGTEGTTASLSGSDVIVSSVGESGQVDKPGRHGKRRR